MVEIKEHESLASIINFECALSTYFVVIVYIFECIYLIAYTVIKI